MREQIVRKICYLSISLVFIISQQITAAEKESAWQKYQQAAVLFQQTGSPQKIIDLCKSAQKLTDDPVLKARAIFLISQVFITEKNFTKSHKLLADLYNSSDDFPLNITLEARLRDAELYCKENLPSEALRLFQTVCDSAPNPFLQQEARLGLANVLAQKGNWQDSDSILNAVIAASPRYENDERVRILAAQQALSLNNPQRAIAQLQGNQSKISLALLAKAYEQADKPIMAVGVYKKIRDNFPNSAEAEDALFQAGEVFLRAQDWLAARTELIKLSQNYPGSRRMPGVQFRLGWVYLQLKQYKEAFAAFQTVSPNPEHASYFAFMRAECLHRMGALEPEKLQEAILAFNSTAALYSQSAVAPLAKLRAALILFEKGKDSDAIISLRQFLSIYTKDELVATANFLLATKGEPGMSGHYFNNLIDKYPDSYLFDAALTALQEIDYKHNKYQEIINRQAHRGQLLDGNDYSKWQRAQFLLHAESSYYLQHYDQAQHDYEKASNEADDEIAHNARLGSAWCILQQGFTDSARVIFAELQQTLPGAAYVKAAYGLATAHFRAKDYEKALQTFPANLQDEGNPELRALIVKSLYHSGESYYRLEYYGQAIETWLKLVDNFPQDALAARSQYRAADTYFRANHFEKAAAAYQTVLDQYNGSKFASESMLQLAQCKYNAGDYQAAVTGFEKYIATYPQHAQTKDALEGIQLSYYQMGQGSQASAALEKVIQNFPDGMLSADARYRLAASYLEAKDYEKAVTAFKEILTQFPGTSYAMDAQFALAGAYQTKGDNDLANAEYQRFIQYFPDSPNIAEATFNLAVGYFNLESYLSASDYFSQITEKYQSSSFYKPALQNLGWCFKRLGENEKALQYFQTFVDKNAVGPERENMSLQIATIKAELGQENEALPVFTTLSKSNNGEIAAEAAYQRGMLLLKKESSESARKAFSLAIKKGSSDNYYRLSSLAQLGAIYEGRRSWKKAIAAYKLLADSASDPTWVAAAQDRMQAIASRISTE
ncbi:MAG: outer membrane protein assembly factor BamD [Calditrichaeota bacterium]|nr:MAG: outer membrane protein assembly factor BamD [Calditrichota bacterium]